MKLTEEKIIELIEFVFKQKKHIITRDTALEKVAKDSMDIVEFIAILKKRYKVRIEPSEIARLQNIGEVIDYILTHQEKVGV